jgi:hypothetical protein
MTTTSAGSHMDIAAIKLAYPLLKSSSELESA